MTDLRKKLAKFMDNKINCPSCGGPPAPSEKVEYEFILEDDETEEQAAEPRECPNCGRALIIDLYYDDDPRSPINRV